MKDIKPFHQPQGFYPDGTSWPFFDMLFSIQLQKRMCSRRAGRTVRCEACLLFSYAGYTKIDGGEGCWWMQNQPQWHAYLSAEREKKKGFIQKVIKIKFFKSRRNFNSNPPTKILK